ncbi:tyrosine-protein phosphatase non-receptor type 13-like isoform X1 [Cimex lectularius]|uniref:PDZ domain-containing protein n=2 Tax=Cimex lectularius TaxID=79782 RepID=A0A8I6RJK4_CIMLE|nr:tyrosine-protein phosphatase non-receptor type 13-like isoform X1 [Cimex lectularius]
MLDFVRKWDCQPKWKLCIKPWTLCFGICYGVGRTGGGEMGSNLSKRRSQSSGNLTGKLPQDKYKLCGSLPNHLDLPNNDNNNETVKGRVEDLGYGSERSPDDPEPPFPACPVHHAHFIKKYPFINSNSVFSVIVRKGTGGLGLSVCGGEPWPGLIRIKRLFPHQPASHSGLLSPGDILLAASSVPLLGLTNYEALEVLRSSPSEVKLTVCRPPEPVIPPVETVAPPPPPRDTPTPMMQENYGEFEIVMEKVNGSLGFTLRKEDQSVLGHYVRALVREPALSDLRLRPGDKIVAVNDVEMSNLTHEEAVAFLRKCGDLVRLRLYRDSMQTPIPSHSPTHSHRTFKPILRKEAQDMLCELAVKKSQSPPDSSGSSKGSSPRKRRLTRTPPPADSAESFESGEDEHLKQTEQLSVYDNVKTSCKFSPNLATQSSEEELVSTGLSGNEPPPSEPVSMPPMGTCDNDSETGFSYRNPAYRSANPPVTKPLASQEITESGCSEQDIPRAVEGTKSLLKWKGVLFKSDESDTCSVELAHTESITSQGPEELPEAPEYQVVLVELNRGWNSRLGFSLQSSENGGSVISAIYPDSVASRDGRLRIGDRLINVNDESIENMETTDVIDLLRKIRGSISLTLLRKSK